MTWNGLAFIDEKVRRHDTQYNDIQHNAIQHNDIQNDDIQHNAFQHYAIQHNAIQHNIRKDYFQVKSNLLTVDNLVFHF